jgi:hypothetical protein
MVDNIQQLLERIDLGDFVRENNWLRTQMMYPLVMTSHGIDGPFIDGLPIKNGDFQWLC